MPAFISKKNQLKKKMIRLEKAEKTFIKKMNKNAQGDKIGLTRRWTFVKPTTQVGGVTEWMTWFSL